MIATRTLIAVFVASTPFASNAVVVDPVPTTTVRFATFNASLNRNASGDLLSDLANPSGTGASPTVLGRIQQAKNVAEIIQRIPSFLC